jgi:sugar/nucleoside kinase (ribokinase family)
MTQAEYSSLRNLLIGKLNRDFYILPDGKVRLNEPGGNLLYAAVGLKLWEPDLPPGLVARVGEDYPQEWLALFRQRGFDPRGIRITTELIDSRSFYVFTDRTTRIVDDPVPHFARVGESFPKELLRYRVPKSQLDSRSQLSAISIRQADFPSDFLEASAAHICAVDYLTQMLVPAVLRQNGFTTITIDPSPGMMTPMFWDDFPAVLTGLTAFLPSEPEIRGLFLGRSTDIWEMAEALAVFGCEFIVIKRGEGGQLLYDATSKARWEIPSYPARVVNLTGAGDAFCGGFLAGYRRTFDPLLATLHGNISASMTVEGNGAFYALEGLPGLAEARMDALRDTIRRI